MWGMLGYKSGPKERVPLGYIGDLTPEMEECLKAFKEWVVTNRFDQNPWFNDMVYLKFCRARKFDLEKVQIMFNAYMDMRKEQNLDTIINDFKHDKLQEIFPYYKRGYCGVDKLGRPVYIEQAGHVDPDKIWTICDEDYLWTSYFQSYEIFIKQHLMACSLIAGKQIQHSLCIQDLTGFGMSKFGGKVKALVQKASKISQDYYPEMLGRLYIVNAPYVFSACWTVIKGWLDEKTRKKITVMSNGHKKVLLEQVDEDQLMEFLGGTNKAQLVDNVGPWNDYEVVDGSQPGDVVGIRKTSDGPEGKIFTPADLMALPNYLLDGTFNEDGEKVEEEKE